jgi:hypothetical protein
MLLERNKLVFGKKITEGIRDFVDFWDYFDRFSIYTPIGSKEPKNRPKP